MRRIMLSGILAFKEGRRTSDQLTFTTGSMRAKKKVFSREETFRVDEFTVKQWELFQQNQE